MEPQRAIAMLLVGLEDVASDIRFHNGHVQFNTVEKHWRDVPDGIETARRRLETHVVVVR